MVRIKGFRALRPPADRADRVASVPYDVVSRDEAIALAKGNPASFLHVVRPDIDLPKDQSKGDALYRRAREALQEFERDGMLQRDPDEALYIYRLEAMLLGEMRVQTGLVGCCHIDDYAKGLIKRHEKTRKDKEDERTRFVLEQDANAEPVFFLFKSDEALARAIAKDSAGKPLYDFEAPDGVRHTIWKVADASPYTGAFAKLNAVYVADGHHRTASAARAGADLRAKNPAHTGEEEYNWFLTVLFPASELTILPYHRTVSELNGLAPGDFLARLSSVGRVEQTTTPNPDRTGTFGVYLDGAWYRLSLDESTIDRSDPVASLDYELLSERILRPILGVEDIRTDDRVDFVGGIRGTGELKKRVDEGRAAAAFAMHPVTIEQLIAVADAGQIMPPKSTWFEPKLRSGLLVHTLDSTSKP